MKFFREITIKKKKLIARGLRAFREKCGIGMRELARASKVSSSSVSAIELGINNPSKKTAEKIEQTLLRLSKRR